MLQGRDAAPGGERDCGGKRGGQGAGLLDDVSPMVDLRRLVAVGVVDEWVEGARGWVRGRALSARAAVTRALAASTEASN